MRTSHSKGDEALKRQEPTAWRAPKVPSHCPGGSPRWVCGSTESEQPFGKAHLEQKSAARGKCVLRVSELAPARSQPVGWVQKVRMFSLSLGPS